MSLKFKPQKRIFECFDRDFDNIILTTFEFDREFIEDRLLPILVGKKAVKDLNDRLEVEDALQNKSISIIASGNIHDKRTLYGYDLIPYNGTQHSKIALLANKDLIRIIIGSANLTENAFCKNLETLCFLDFEEGSGLPNSLASDILSYLEIISDNKGKVREQISEIAAWLDLMQLDHDWKRNDFTIKFLAYPNPAKNFIVDQLFDELGDEKIQRLKILTPFFEREDSRFFGYFIDEFTKRGVQNLGIYFPSLSEASGGDIKWHIPSDKTILENAKKYQDLIHFHPISTAEHTENRDIHAKLIFISTHKANYLLVGSSNFTKKGFGFEKANPNAEANLLFKVQNPNERKLRDFLPSDIAEQKIEFLKPIQPDITGEDTENPLPQIIYYAYYKDGRLTIELSDTCYDKAYNWEIFLMDEKILDASGWNKERKFEKEIPLSNMAQKSLDLEIRIDSGTYYCPIFFYDSSQLIKERHKNISIDTDNLILYWLNRISRPKIPEGVIDKPRNGDGKSTKPVETPDLLMNKIKMFVKGLEGVREYLKEDKIANPVMLKNRIYGIFGADRIFKTIDDLDDKLTKLFCYSEMKTLVNDISLHYKDEEKKWILEEYKRNLKNKIAEFKKTDLPMEWQTYLKHMETQYENP
ncbi:MAG: hypothetical protein HRF42_08080 [Candidatus Brocadia sp.]|jgi:hypothetical protein